MESGFSRENAAPHLTGERTEHRKSSCRKPDSGPVDHIVATWYDLNHLILGTQPLRFVSLFDDTIDIWTPENIRLVGDLSDVAYWSHPDEFHQLLVE